MKIQIVIENENVINPKHLIEELIQELFNLSDNEVSSGSLSWTNAETDSLLQLRRDSFIREEIENPSIVKFD